MARNRTLQSELEDAIWILFATFRQCRIDLKGLERIQVQALVSVWVGDIGRSQGSFYAHTTHMSVVFIWWIWIQKKRKEQNSLIHSYSYSHFKSTDTKRISLQICCSLLEKLNLIISKRIRERKVCFYAIWVHLQCALGPHVKVNVYMQRFWMQLYYFKHFFSNLIQKY